MVPGYRNRLARVRMCQNIQFPMSSQPIIAELILATFERRLISNILVDPVVPETLANGLGSEHSPSRVMGYFPEARSPRPLVRSIQPTSHADLGASSLRARSWIRKGEPEAERK